MDRYVKEPETAEFELGNPEAVLAGTLALMTALIQGVCEEHRPAICRKVMANLAELERQPALSREFRAVATHLQQHWFALGERRPPRAFADTRLWQMPAQVTQ